MFVFCIIETNKSIKKKIIIIIKVQLPKPDKKWNMRLYNMAWVDIALLDLSRLIFIAGVQVYKSFLRL